MAEKADVPRTVALSVMGSVLAGFLVQILSKVLLPDLTGVLSLTVRLYIFALIVLAIGFAIYYLLILGGCAAAAGSPEREGFEALEARLLAGGTPNKVYNDILARALDAVDRFFGDPNRADVSWFTRVTGWNPKGARWTAKAYDRCLLLALVYPIATIFLAWVVTGHAGDAGKALLLKEGLAYWRRVASLIALAVSSGLALYSARTQGRGSSPVAFAFAGAFAVAGAFAGDDAVAFAFAVAVAGAGAVAGAVAGAFAFAVAFAVAVAGAVVVVVGAVVLILAWAEKHRVLGLGLTGFSVIFGTISVMAPFWLGSRPGWDRAGAWLLFLGLFTLVNAPVDWLALGITRALLRRGLAQGGWLAFLYAVIDLVAAMALVAGLAFAMVLAAQAFDDFAVLGGGTQAHILRVTPLLDQLQANPAALENAWVWFTLFSSMIPSVLNLMIACFSFLRGLPFVHRWLLRRMLVKGRMNETDRILVASVLTGQVVLGAGLTAAVLYRLATQVVWLVMPWFAGVLLDFAKAVSDANFLAHWLAR